MSDVELNLCEPDSCGDQGEPCPDPVTPPSADLQGPQPAGQSPPADASPSPSAETSGLLSLPWEMVSHIASYLPAQCVFAVLPKVCRALSNLENDSNAWQLRARRLIGSQAGFPVGPREDFDWLTACLEMEQLIICWKTQEELLARQARDEEAEDFQVRQQQQAEQDRDPGAGEQDGGREAQGEGAGVQVIVENEGGGELGAIIEEEEEERDHWMMFDVNQEDGALDHQENLVDHRNLGNRRQAEMEQSPSCRSPSAPPDLECTTILTDHIASINSVLLVGGEGKVCATGSRDWNVKLWDIQAGSSGRLLDTLGGQNALHTHRGWVWCLASQGSLLASGCFDSTVRLWDLQAGGAVGGLIRADSAVLCLSCQADVLLAGTMKTITMWDTRAANPVVDILHHHSNAVMCLAADDKCIISGSKDHTVAVYDRRAGRVLKKLQLTSYLRSMSYSGSEVWAGDNKGMLYSFPLHAGTLKDKGSKFDVGHTAMVTGVHRSLGSLYTCSFDRTVKVHIPCGPPRTLCTLHHQVGVSGLNVDAGVLAVATGDVCVDVWRPRK